MTIVFLSFPLYNNVLIDFPAKICSPDADEHYELLCLVISHHLHLSGTVQQTTTVALVVEAAREMEFVCSTE